MIIYKTTNLINGKIYIGRDSSDCKTYYGGGKYIRLALKKYGKENFIKCTIDIAEDIRDLILKETFWIKFYDATNKMVGYNILTDGHNGGWQIVNERYKVTGRTFSAERNKKLSISKTGVKRKPFSEECKRNMSLAHPKSITEKHKQNIGLAQKGKTLTEEHRQKIRATMAAGRMKGKNHPLFGKKCPSISTAKKEYWAKWREDKLKKEAA